MLKTTRQRTQFPRISTRCNVVLRGGMSWAKRQQGRSSSLSPLACSQRPRPSIEKVGANKQSPIDSVKDDSRGRPCPIYLQGGCGSAQVRVWREARSCEGKLCISRNLPRKSCHVADSVKWPLPHRPRSFDNENREQSRRKDDEEGEEDDEQILHSFPWK